MSKPEEKTKELQPHELNYWAYIWTREFEKLTGSRLAFYLGSHSARLYGHEQVWRYVQQFPVEFGIGHLVPLENIKL